MIRVLRLEVSKLSAMAVVVSSINNVDVDIVDTLNYSVVSSSGISLFCFTWS